MRLLKFLLAVTLSAGCSAQAAEIKVLSASAVREALSELAPQFEKASGHTLSITWSSSPTIRKQIAEGQKFDLVVTSAPDIAQFMAQRVVDPGSEVPLGKTGVAAAVRESSRKPDISTVDQLRRAILDATGIAYSTGASGQYVLKMIDNMGILESVKPKLREATPGGRIATLLVNGTADLGFQQMSEFTHERGIAILGYLPAELQNWTIWSTGVSSASAQPEPARSLQKFLTGSGPVWKAHDIEPLNR